VITRPPHNVKSVRKRARYIYRPERCLYALLKKKDFVCYKEKKMGYDVRMILGNRWNFDSTNKEHLNEDGNIMSSFEVVAEIELCGVGNGLHSLMREQPISTYYFYSQYGNDDVVKDDCYGDFKMFTDVKELYQRVMKEQSGAISEYGNHRGYRRYDILLAALKSLLDNFDSPVVIWYGH